MLLPDLLKRGPKHILGLNSGTSVDSLDWALLACRGSRPNVQVMAAGTASYPARLREALRACAAAETVNKEDIAHLDQDYGRWLGQQIARLRCSFPPSQRIDLVASHGQTVGHWPRGSHAVTMQIGDPDQIAKVSGLPVVSHFRYGDVATGGEGAPLTPAVNAILFAHRTRPSALLNLGGIANLSILPPRNSGTRPIGTDCGPGNMLLDLAAQRLLGKPCDRGGGTAARGTVQPKLFAVLKRHPWFKRRLPTSCGREEFGEAYFDALLKRPPALPPKDVLATLTQLTVWSVRRAIDSFPLSPHVLHVAGGGVHNRTLMRALAQAVAPLRVASIAERGFNPDTLEAVSFGVLGYLFIREIPVDLHDTTGARRPAVLGRLTLP